MSTHIERIAQYNELTLKEISKGVFISDPVTYDGRRIVYKLTDAEKRVEVERRIISKNSDEVEETRAMDLPHEITELYSHVLFPNVTVLGPAEKNKQYPLISASDPAIMAYLGFPGDLVLIIRLVSYAGAGTQKNGVLYRVV